MNHFLGAHAIQGNVGNEGSRRLLSLAHTQYQIRVTRLQKESLLEGIVWCNCLVRDEIDL